MGKISIESLEADGWVQRFTASGARLEEAVENYRLLGYEVRTVPVRELDTDGCAVCFEDETDTTVMIFTREHAAG